MKNPDFLLISHDADAYVALLGELASNSSGKAFCRGAEDALAAYDGQQIVVGEPSEIAKVLADMPAVEWVQSTWAGVTPLLEIERRDYVLTNVKGVYGAQMSEYVFAYLLAHEIRLSRRAKAQHDRDWDFSSSGTLAGKRLGIMGTGSISRHIARVARTFEMSVTGLSRSGALQQEFDGVRPVSEIKEFLDGLDYLVTVLPDTPETDHLLDSAAFQRLPKHCYLINVGRGNVVDEKALVNALRSNSIAGAALDVFNEEPLPTDSPLWDAPNLSITGHIAATSYPSTIAPVFLENYRCFCAGEPLQFVVDFEAGY